MGFSFSIGEAGIEWSDDCVRIVVAKRERHDSAPAFGEPTDFTNERWPSYTAWASTCEALGIKDVMSDEVEFDGGYLAPLIPEHPGAAPLTAGHLKYLTQKVEAYKVANPTHIAQYPPPKAGAQPLFEGGNIYREEDYDEDPKYDAVLCRAEWLLYWVKWAVENCQQPVFVNR